jgi:DNA helicase HerA-like ATPase
MTETREYVRVTPTSQTVATDAVPTELGSLHKLSGEDGDGGLLNALNPFAGEGPPRFEFLVLSAGADEPVGFYYGADAHLSTLEQRLRSIYPETFDVERTTLDVARHLIPTRTYDPDAYVAAVEDDALLTSPPDASVEATSTETDVRTREVTDGGVATTTLSVDGGDSVRVYAPPDGGSSATPPRDHRLTGDGTVHARPSVDRCDPVGVRWEGTATRSDDWMTTLAAGAWREDDQTNATPPLATLVDRLAAFDCPVAFQAVIRRKPDWTAEADLRTEAIAEGRDTFAQELASTLFGLDGRGVDDQGPTGPASRRIERIEDAAPARSFAVNLRAVAVPGKTTPPGEESPRAAASRRMDELRPVFDPLDGPFYGVEGRRFRSLGWRRRTGDRYACRGLQRLLDRDLVTDDGDTRPDLVVSPDELAPFVVVPGADRFTVAGVRETRAEQRTRNPLPRPHQDHMAKLRRGMAIGYAVDETGDPEATPTRVPPDLLPTHYGRFGTTGSGKSKALANDLLSLYAETSGPTILIDPKGDGMTQNYMRAHAHRFGTDDLEANVLHFPVPEVLPGFAFFDLEPALDAGQRRIDAVQRVADHYQEVLKLVMGTEQYERATVAPTLIRALVDALFDDEYGRENGRYRESADRFAHNQLENLLDDLWTAGPPDPDLDGAPTSSDPEVTRTIRRQLQLDPGTFATVLGGVSNRLAYISQNTHLRRVFDNTERRFDFRELLDEDTVVLFDLGDLRDEATRAMTAVILTQLQAALADRQTDLAERPDDYVVNLLVDEAASVVVSDVLNDLLEKGRSYRLSVGLSMQFPEQMETAGNRRVYLNALNNVGTTLVGKINVDRDLARAMAHEDLDPETFATRIRSLPRGEWVASLPSPTFGETGPYPFSLAPLPVPAGHPESERPLTAEEEQRFETVVDRLHERVAAEYGVPDDGGPPDETVPEAVREFVDAEDGDLDVAMAATVRRCQLRRDCRADNGWIPVQVVDETLWELFDNLDQADTAPATETLADVRDRSRLLEVTVDVDADQVVVRLTDDAEEQVAPDTGAVRAAGGDDHDDGVLAAEAALTEVGFTVSILSQDGSTMPDARATHPDLDTTVAVEVETTTPSKPAQVLANLRGAQESDETPVFVVPGGETEHGEESALDRAGRLASVLADPVREVEGETRFYTTAERVTVDGSDGRTITAVRPVCGPDDRRRTAWERVGEDLVLRDGDGGTCARVPSLAALSPARLPATATYDPHNDEYVVESGGSRHRYDSRAAMATDWVPVKRPFVPEEELPAPEYGPDDYAIVVLGETPGVYHDGDLAPLSTLADVLTSDDESTSIDDEADGPRSGDGVDSTADSRSDGSDTPPSWATDPDSVAERFAKECLREVDSGSVPSARAFEVYEAWAETHEHEVATDARNWFTRRLGNHVEFESTVVDGGSERVFDGLELVEEWQ